MKTPRQEDRRANQKARTRSAIVAAAGELMRRGARPTVAEAAEAARVSKATAYRYFPTQEALLVDVAELAPATAPVEEVVASLPDSDTEDRLLRLHEAFCRVAVTEEASMRNALRVSLDTWLMSRRAGGDPPPVREGRRMRWLDVTLAPARREFSARELRRLRCALSLTMGIEPFVVMKDVCRLEDDDEIADVLRWAATTLLRAARQEAAGARGGARRAAPRRRS